MPTSSTSARFLILEANPAAPCARANPQLTRSAGADQCGGVVCRPSLHIPHTFCFAGAGLEAVLALFG